MPFMEVTFDPRNRPAAGPVQNQDVPVWVEDDTLLCGAE